MSATRVRIVEVLLQRTFYAGGRAVWNSLVGLRDLLSG